MRFTFASFFVLAMAVFTACQTGGNGPAGAELASKDLLPPVSGKPAGEAPKADEHGHEDNAPRIELVDAKSLYDSGEAVFIDTRSEDSFVLEHIKGALNIPLASLESRLGEVPEGKTLIAYCS